jgi:hypothetical protein
MPNASSAPDHVGGPSEMTQASVDAWSLSASEAGEILQQLALDFHQQQVPLHPTTSHDAALRLTELSADPAFYQKLMRGDVDARRQFDELTALRASGDMITDPTPLELGETTVGDSGLARRHLIGVAADMRRDGFPDRAIEHILSDGRFDAEAVAISQHWIPRMEADPNLLCPDAEQWGWPQDREYQLRCFRTIAAIGTDDMP